MSGRKGTSSQSSMFSFCFSFISPGAGHLKPCTVTAVTRAERPEALGDSGVEDSIKDNS